MEVKFLVLTYLWVILCFVVITILYNLLKRDEKLKRLSRQLKVKGELLDEYKRLFDIQCVQNTHLKKKMAVLEIELQNSRESLSEADKKADMLLVMCDELRNALSIFEERAKKDINLQTGPTQSKPTQGETDGSGNK